MIVLLKSKIRGQKGRVGVRVLEEGFDIQIVGEEGGREPES